MKIPNSFSSTIFNRHRIQYKSGVFSETNLSNVFFFLPSTTHRIESINRYVGSINLNPIDIELSDFGPNFDPSRLDYAGPQKEDTRMSRSQYISLSDDEKLKMLKRFYKALLPVYFSSGKHQFCCNDCVWFDDGKKQDCLKCKVNVMACSCFSEFSADEKVPSVNAFKNNGYCNKSI